MSESFLSFSLTPAVGEEPSKQFCSLKHETGFLRKPLTVVSVGGFLFHFSGIFEEQTEFFHLHEHFRIHTFIFFVCFA